MTYKHEDLLDAMLSGDTKQRVAATAKLGRLGFQGMRLVCEAPTCLNYGQPVVITFGELATHLRRTERLGALHCHGVDRIHGRHNVRWYDEDTDRVLLTGSAAAGSR